MMWLDLAKRESIATLGRVDWEYMAKLLAATGAYLEPGDCKGSRYAKPSAPTLPVKPKHKAIDELPEGMKEISE